MHTMTVLRDGLFKIEWRGGRTFNVYALDAAVNVFSAGYELSASELTEEWARRTAHEWWTEGGKEATQENNTRRIRTMYARPLDVCETCMLIIANASTDGAYSEADEERSAEAMSDRGPFTLGDGDATELGHSHFECDICGALPGERFRVYEWDS